MSSKQLHRVLAAALLAASALLSPLPTPVHAACPFDHASKFANHIPQQQANGARMNWKARTLVSTDWNIPPFGFAAQVLWAGTDNRQANDAWVEVGVTHGFGGQSVYRFYSARQTDSGVYNEAIFVTKFPQVGSIYTFSVYSSAGGIYNATVTDTSGGSATRSWTGHQPFTVNYSGGSEVTCATNRVDRTFVSLNQFRRAADLVWVNINNGSLGGVDPNGFVAWCVQPRTFRYGHRSVIDPSICA
jgi:hypothetical protein